MIHKQIWERGICDQLVLNAMLNVPRHLFMRSDMTTRSYHDQAAPIDCQQTISQPYIVALMTELLELDSQSKVLEIGTGSGYQTAVLAEIVDSVYTVEIIQELADRAWELLGSLGYENIESKVGNGYYGWADHAPYDRIIVTAAPSTIPDVLIDQLAVDGRLVIPVGDVDQDLVLVTKTMKGVERKVISGVRFVLMTSPLT
ncbi:protein-L-isoaspartate O-methyltransferase [Candidatus Poribacteria bacterium]|nr:protein-L-isoaspartate O-methyltransferase [Candidatus Poribacteria bacterium]